MRGRMGGILTGLMLYATVAATAALAVCHRMRRPIPDILAVVVVVGVAVCSLIAAIQFLTP
jgi:hypothetical protein